MLEQEWFGRERRNTVACAVKLRGGVDGGDGERLRERDCGTLVV